MDDREVAWSAVQDALEGLPGSLATPSLLYVEENPPRWHVTAVHADVRGRRVRHEALEGAGTTEIEALEALSRLLEERARG